MDVKILPYYVTCGEYFLSKDLKFVAHCQIRIGTKGLLFYTRMVPFPKHSNYANTCDYYR